jgi:hypothetical protein
MNDLIFDMSQNFNKKNLGWSFNKLRVQTGFYRSISVRFFAKNFYFYLYANPFNLHSIFDGFVGRGWSPIKTHAAAIQALHAAGWAVANAGYLYDSRQPWIHLDRHKGRPELL